MAPFDGKLTDKISPLIEGQVPDFVQAEHPTFVSFLKSYYEFLEAGELQVTVVIDSLRMETISDSFIISEGDVPVKFNTEIGTGSTGKFDVGETITGRISKATATVLVDDLTNTVQPRIFISSQQKFAEGEIVDGGTSGAQATITKYRGNPVQTIQQLLEFANTDNTTSIFLDEMFNQFLEAIPRSLASGTSKRDLVKSINDLYAAKGTSEGHKFFLRLMFAEEAEIVYPNKFMLRASKGNWTEPTIMRIESQASSDALDIIGQTITGKTSGATTVVLNAIVFFQGIESVSELEIDKDNTFGTFDIGETVTANSNTKDVEMFFTVRSFITTATIVSGGGKYKPTDSVRITSDTGNDMAEAEVSAVSTGEVSGVSIDAVGAGYRVGDVVTFTKDSGDANTVAEALGFISVTDGALLLEDTVGNDDYLILEPDSVHSVEHLNIILEGTDSEKSNEGSYLIFDATNGSSLDENYRFITEQTVLQLDRYGGDDDRFMLDVGAADTEGSIHRVRFNNKGSGYSKLPTVTVTSQTGLGSGVSLQALSTDIGKVIEVKILDGGFKYTGEPVGLMNTHMVLKNVTGTFTPSSPLTSTGHVGKVVYYNSTNKHLEVLVENRVRTQLEMTGSDFTQTLELERAEFPGTVTPAKYLAINNIYDNQGGKFALEDNSGFLISNALETYVNQINIEGPFNSINEYVELENQASEISLGEFTGFTNAQALGRITGTLEDVTSSHSIGRGYRLMMDGYADLGNIVLNGTDGSSTNAGDDLIMEDNLGNPIVSQQSRFEGDMIVFENALMYPRGFLSRGDRLQLDGSSIQLHTSGGWINKDRVIGTLQATPDPILGYQRSVDDTEHFLLEDACADTTNNTQEYLLMENPHHKVVVDRTAVKIDEPDVFGRYVVDSSKTINHGSATISLDGSFSDVTRLMGENLEGFILEDSMNVTIGEGTYLTIDNDFIDGAINDIRIVMEGTDGNYPQADAGDFILAEDWGASIMQESGLNIGDYPDVTGDAFIDEGEDWSSTCFILLDGMDSSGSHAGSYLIEETAPDFVGGTITDNDGATATIVSSDTGTLTFGTDVISDKPGYYRNTDHHISDGVIKLQDSYFYQDFSYEIRLGQSVNLYMNELKKAIHPTGFAAFGRVTIATQVAASIQTPTATGVIDYTGDTDLFTPTLASMFDNIFQIQIPRRLSVGRWNEGEVFDKIGMESPYLFRMEDDTGYLTINESGDIIQQENSSDYIVLNGTDGSSTNAGDYIYSNVDNAGSFYLGELSDSSEHIIAEDYYHNVLMGTERSSAPSYNKELELLQKVKVTVNLPQAIYYAKAGGWTGGLPLIKDGYSSSHNMEMEDGSSGRIPTIVRDVILLDGVEQGSGAVADIGDYLVWEEETDPDYGTDLSIEDLQYRSNDDIVLEQSATFNDIVALEYATDTWVDVNTPNLLLLNGTDGSSSNANSRLLNQDDVNSYGDDLVLDGIDSSSTGAGAKIVSEDILNGEISINEIETAFTLALEGKGIGDSGSDGRILAESVDTSNEDGEVILESRFDVFLIEGDTWGRVMSESDGGMAQEDGESEGLGQNMIVENATTPQLGGIFKLESVALEAEDATGTVAPDINFQDSNLVHFTRPAVIRKEAVGRIALQDERQPVGLMQEGIGPQDSLVLDGTTGIGGNAGSKIEGETMIHIILEQHHPGFVLLNGTDGSSSNAGEYVDFEIGTRPPFDYTLQSDEFDATYDSTQTTYDTTQQTYDATV